MIAHMYVATGGRTSVSNMGLQLFFADLCGKYQIIAKHSGQTVKKVHDDSDRDYWMKADEAKKYGMIDEILTRDK